MNTHLAIKYDRPVPRYTSYPTAPHFDDSVTASLYADWLGAQDNSNAASIYLHVPFCDTLCWFCGCQTRIVRRYAPVADYLNALTAEIDLVARHLPARFRVGHVHWGGGSPTLLSPADWARMSAHLRARFDFTDGVSHAVELDPRETTEAYVAALRAAGVNRVSIGIQDFDPAVQRAINRHQSLDQTRRVVDWLRDHGIAKVNFDLMYGLPHQDVGHLLATVDIALRLEPRRVALFGYAHVPWMRAHQRLIDADALPGAEARWAQAERAADRLVEAGFVRIGFDHFARSGEGLATAFAEGRLRRNFQGYTDDASPLLIGLGASSIGKLPQGYVQNVTSVRRYARDVCERRLPVARGRALTAADRRRAAII
jgi:oxygen-independent coproporphyrinogen-3 oxidase